MVLFWLPFTFIDMQSCFMTSSVATFVVVIV